MARATDFVARATDFVACATATDFVACGMLITTPPRTDEIQNALISRRVGS